MSDFGRHVLGPVIGNEIRFNHQRICNRVSRKHTERRNCALLTLCNESLVCLRHNAEMLDVKILIMPRILSVAQAGPPVKAPVWSTTPQPARGGEGEQAATTTTLEHQPVGGYILIAGIGLTFDMPASFSAA